MNPKNRERRTLFCGRPADTGCSRVNDSMLDFMIDRAHRAGMLLLSMFEGQRDVKLKSPFELVTDADHASEALIVSAITRQYSGHAIVAEESGGAPAASGYTWL